MIGFRKHVGWFPVLAGCGGWLVLAGLVSSAVADNGPRLTPPDVPPLVLSDLPTLPPPSRPEEQAAAEPRASEPTQTAQRPLLFPADPVPYETARPEVVVMEEPIPAPMIVESPVARPVPKIAYHSDRGARRMLARYGQVELVMVTQNPADGCLYEIPLCIPACCVGEPTVKSKRGIFGRGVVEYCWPSGFEVKVKFRHVLGDVKVEYDG